MRQNNTEGNPTSPDLPKGSSKIPDYLLRSAEPEHQKKSLLSKLQGTIVTKIICLEELNEKGITTLDKSVVASFDDIIDAKGPVEEATRIMTAFFISGNRLTEQARKWRAEHTELTTVNVSVQMPEAVKTLIPSEPIPTT